jgi:pyruvate dehydrogenase E1 component alpha subunit
MELTKDKILTLYTNMVRARKLDEFMVNALYRGKVLSFYHSGQGEEAVSAGAYSFLKDDDYVTLTHRGHGLGYIIAKGGSAKEFVAEHYGKAGGATRGLTGWHYVDPEKGMLGYSGVLGSCFSISLGWGMAAKMNQKRQVSVCIFGDGTSGRGTIHEAMNMASLMKLPIIYICNNNGMAQFTPIAHAYPKSDIAALAAGYDIPGVVVDGQDVIAVHEAVSAAVERARDGNGPAMVECKTIRYRAHSEGIPDVVHYTARTPEAITELKKRDPILLFRAKLMNDKLLTEADVKRIDELADAEAAEAEKFAEESPFPDPKVLSETF